MSGNVGIGTTDDGRRRIQALHQRVNGATYINGNHTIAGTKSAFDSVPRVID